MQVHSCMISKNPFCVYCVPGTILGLRNTLQCCSTWGSCHHRYLHNSIRKINKQLIVRTISFMQRLSFLQEQFLTGEILDGILCVSFQWLLGGASQKTVMLGSCLQAQQSIINSVRGWCLPMEWNSIWGSHFLAIPSVSALSLSFHILQAGNILSQKFCKWVVVLILHWESCLATGGGHYRIHIPH